MRIFTGAAAATIVLTASRVVMTGAPADAAGKAAIYTTAQAAAGMKAYTASCSACHGAKLQGVVAPPLQGPNAPIQGIRTVSWVYRFVRMQMPQNKPGSLDAATYTAIVAYILQRNGHPAGAKPLTPAAASTSLERM